MKATIGHVGINLSSSENFSFWKELCQHLEFEFDEDDYHFHAFDGNGYLCVSVVEESFERDQFHRKRTGLNHVAFQVSTKEKVDKFVSDFLEPRKIKPLYGGAKEYPDYATEYYAVYFEDKDRIKIEVVYELSDS